jgi:hypothetical protein
MQIEIMGPKNSLPQNIHFIYMLKVDEVDKMKCMADDGPTHHHDESRSKVAQKNNAGLNNGNKS